MKAFLPVALKRPHLEKSVCYRRRTRYLFWAPSEGLYLPPAVTRLLSKVPFAALMRVVRREYTVKLLLSYILVSGQSQWSAICEDKTQEYIILLKERTLGKFT